MSGLLVSLYDDAYSELGEITWHQNKMKYAERWGLDAVVKTRNFHRVPHLGFAKIALMLEVAERRVHDWLFWSGADTFITNFNVPLTDFLYPGKTLTIAHDASFLQSDSFVIRNNAIGRGYLARIMEAMPRYLPWSHEQQAMIDLEDEYREHTQYVPQRFLNAYAYEELEIPEGPYDTFGYNGSWRKGDFLVHINKMPYPTRVAKAREYLEKTVY
jgi:hypothetical protein